MSAIERWSFWGAGLLLLLAAQTADAGERQRGVPVRHLHTAKSPLPATPPDILLHEIDESLTQRRAGFPCILGEVPEGVNPGVLASREPARTTLDLMRAGDWEGLRRHVASVKALGGGPDTVRIAVIRVDFLEDTGGNGSTTTDGRFDLRSNDEAQAAIDPPPHNKAYFESHMEALRRYYWKQSGGSLYLDYDVFPAESDSAYHLSDTGDYGPWIISVDNPDLLALAEKFVTDAIMTADTTDPTLDYGAYDSHIIFHSGTDFQGDINRDTPYDIPSFNLFLADPIAVEDSTVFLNLVMVVPETVSQDEFLGGLNGVVTHEYGHQLGFWDLYDVFTFLPVVGWFSLMDSGDNTFGTVFDEFREEFVFVRGALPAGLDPWHKYLFFGQGVAGCMNCPNAPWPGVTFREIARPGSVCVEPSIVSSEITLLPLNLQEWYLIENRPFDLNDDGTVILRADSTTGVILGPDHDDGAPEDTLATEEYDFLLPGSGLLIWHIDWEAISEGARRFGAINIFSGRRGISVVEADGIPDLGDPFSPEWTGGPYDYWFAGGGFTLLGPDTDPPSDSNHGTPTFIEIEVLDPPGLEMCFTWKRGWTRQGWPRPGYGSIGGGGVGVFDVTGDGRAEILAASGPYIVSWTPEGLDNIWGETRDPGANLTGALSWNPDFVWSTFAGPGAAAAASLEGQVHIWRTQGVEGAVTLTWPDAVTATQEPRVVGTSPVVLDSVVLVGGDDGRVRGLNPDPASAAAVQWRLDPGGGAINALGAGDLNEDGVMDYFWATEGGQVGWTSGPQTGPVRLGSGWRRPVDGDFAVLDIVGSVGRPDLGVKGDPGGLWAIDASGRLLHWPLLGDSLPPEPSLDLSLGGRPAGALTLADLDGDRQLEVIVPLESGEIHVLQLDGSAEPSWPASVWDPDAEPPGVLSEPALVLVGDDAEQGLLFIARPSGEVAALDEDARAVFGWPQTLGFDVPGLWVGDVSGDGDVEVVGGDVAGFVTVIDPPLTMTGATGSWMMPGGDPVRSRFLSAERIPEPPGDDQLAGAEVRIYPNPVRGYECNLEVPITAPASVRMEAVDSEGRQVGSWEWSAVGGPRGERLPVDVSVLPSGFYLCRVFVEGDGTSFSTLEKIAVVR